VEDAVQLLTGHIVLVGLALLLVGFWIAWPRVGGGSSLGTRSPLTFAQTQRAVGLILAVIGLILVVIGMVSHPLY
jgi:hypothetical protein